MFTQYVHPRLGLPKFLTFEPFFLAALEAFDKGKATKFELKGGLSPSTIAARMRDSLHGYRLNFTAWKDRVDPRFIELHAKHEGKFVISGPNEAGEVWFRERHQRGIFKGVPFSEIEGNLPKYLGTKSVVTPSTSPQPADSSIRANSCDENIVRTYVTLKSTGNLSQPVIFPGQVNQPLIDELQSSFDIAFHYDAGRHETILV